MPHEIEIDTEKLHETIHEQMHGHGGHADDGSGWLLKAIALTTAILAAVAAFAALRAGGTVNEALALKTEATRLQAEASDQWAYYQAKGLKAGIVEAQRTVWAAAGKDEPAELAKAQARYAGEQAEIKAKAVELEKTRDARLHESDHLMHGHHLFANAVALLQVAIALGAVAALTRRRLVWYGSMALGLAGLGVIARALM